MWRNGSLVRQGREGKEREIHQDTPFATSSQRRRKPNSHVKEDILEGGRKNTLFVFINVDILSVGNPWIGFGWALDLMDATQVFTQGWVSHEKSVELLYHAR